MLKVLNVNLNYKAMSAMQRLMTSMVAGTLAGVVATVIKRGGKKKNANTNNREQKPLISNSLSSNEDSAYFI